MNTTKYDGNKVVAWSECDWKPKEIIAPMKMSAAVRKGCEMLPNGQLTLSDGCGCALGAALVGAGMRGIPSGSWTTDPNGLHEWPAIRMLSERFGVPAMVLKELSTAHYEGRLTREQIADRLEAQGF